MTKPVDVVRRLYERTSIPFGDEPDLGLELVMHVGFQQLFQWSLTAFCTSGGKINKRAQKRFWKATSEDSGARASVFLALALSAVMGKGGEDVSEKRDAIVKFEPAEEEERFIAEVLREAKAEDACAVLSLRALELAGGRDAARSLPPFEHLGDLDWRGLLQAQNYEWTVVTMLLPGMWSNAIQSFHDA